jgi:hypothetical protein
MKKKKMKKKKMRKKKKKMKKKKKKKKKKLQGREKCEMLEKAFTILTEKMPRWFLFTKGVIDRQSQTIHQ